MIFDSTLLAALAAGLNRLRGARLRDIRQGELNSQGNADSQGEKDGYDERALILTLRGEGVECSVLLETHPARARLHFLKNEPPPSGHPSALTTLFRKHLRGARFDGATQPNFDRILHLAFTNADTLGETHRYTLVAEMADRRANAILLDENGIIIDAVKRLPPFLNRARTVLPHREYSAPPSQRQNPLEIDDWNARVLSAAATENFNATQWLRDHFQGISPLCAQHIEAASDGSTESWANACAGFFYRAKLAADGEYSVVLCEGNQPYPFALHGKNCEAKWQSQGAQSQDALSQDALSQDALSQDALSNALSLSALMEKASAQQGAHDALQNARSSLLSHLGARRKVNEAQRHDAEKALRHAADAERFQTWGNLLLAHIAETEAAARAGQRFVELPDEYSAGSSLINIEIEPKWSAADNATRYFSRYKRAKKLGENAPQRLRELQDEAALLADWQHRAREADAAELENIARQSNAPLSTQGKKVSRSKREEMAARPENKLRRRDIGEFVLFLGRNADENQMMLSKVASPADTWLHVRGRPSAHVIIKAPKGKTPSPEVLHEAGLWVAGAGGRVPAGEKIEILYTQVKFVRAVKGAPGRVTLQRSQTFLVEVKADA